MNFSEQRVNFHNEWPVKSTFKAEIHFAQRLSEKEQEAPFKPIPIGQNEDADYQRCVGHLLDALDQLPYRPDHAFDHFFRIIDKAGSYFYPRKGISGIAQGISEKLFNKNNREWENIIDIICNEMPLRVYELLSKRLLSASLLQYKDSVALNKRAQKVLGKNLYSAFVEKYTKNCDGTIIEDAINKNYKKAASLLKLYMSGKPGTKRRNISNKYLDFTNEKNCPNCVQRSEVILSLLLFTIRNERFHGNIISQFRTSKANLERYESYYYTMLLSYVYALSILNLRFDCVSFHAILNGSKENIFLQKEFFK
ncbi:hypothetical protein NKW54_00565 [Acetobacter cerevisiae]|uniref:Uncharacterized protein n=1 Tax=Acetobacter cerevisiae TaxID=178900 RepID=A0ABT1ER50_9PROT|nr:hypothetical protein [Acetobacter cerevisiae]MCP1244435.1 hypothetical protein [Acetobacter cerevisiae]MCP1254012.1 hypothetical protein [Acetobacter cerevisiae]